MPDLFVTAHTPTLGVGRALRTYAVARALAEHGPVDLLYVAFGADEPARELVEHPAIRLHAIVPSRGARRLASYASARLRGTPRSTARGVSPDIAERAAALLPRPGGGRLIADGMTIRMALRPLEHRYPIIFNGHNLESAFQHQLGEQQLAPAAQMERFERRIFARSAETWMVSHADVAGARQLAPRARVRYVPNVVDVAAIEPVAVPARSDTILLVADYTWPPNAQAVRFLLGEVMPLVWARRPQARLALVGRGLELDGAVDPRVEARGFVDDLGTAYAGAACAVVPLLAGGGSPLKFVEALAHALPVVATPLAAQGLDLTPGEHYVEADGAEAFAAALVGVLAEGADAVAAAGRARVEQAYSIESLAALVAPGVPV